MKKAFGILVPLILWAPLLFAQVKFTATASKTNVGVGEQFEVDFSINANGDRFTPPDLSVFQLLSGPNMSTSEAISNGVTEFNNTYSYIFVATKEGTFNIGAAAIVVNGHTLLSNSLKIKVKGQAPAGQQAQQQQIKVPDPFADDDNSKPAPVDTKNLAKQIFIKAEASKTQAYVGEQIKVAYNRKCERHEIQRNHYKAKRGFPRTCRRSHHRSAYHDHYFANPCKRAFW